MTRRRSVAYTERGHRVREGRAVQRPNQRSGDQVLGFPLMCLNYVLTHQLIGWQGHRAYAVICLVALALNVGLNTRLIPALSILGAAWATVWTEVAITVGCTLALGRLVKVSRPAWRAALGRTGSR